MPVMNQLVKPQVVYIQKETTNQSFLDMHYYLKNKGIQNNDFFLSLLDTGLAGVDPRDPNLSSVMKARIMNECRRNYWYFIREVVRIPTQGGSATGGSRYKLHRGNLAMNFLFVLNYNQFLELPRQKGKTISALCRYLWCYNFGTTNSEIMFMHKDHTGSKKNLRQLKEIRDALPTYLQMSSAVTNEGKHLKVPNTVVMIQHPYNNNKIVTFPSARTADSANNLGRGSTQPLQYYDEFAFIPYNKEVFMAAVPAFSTASENARRNNSPYGILLTTTPGDLLTDSGTYAYNLRNDATPWNELYYDFTYEQLEGLREANHNNTFFFVRYTYQQLGDGQDYFKRMVKEMGRSWPDIRREVMLEWAETATDCAFLQDDLDKIKTFLKEPKRVLLFGRFKQYTFNIYEDLNLTYPPIIGVDVSGATMRDASAITIIDSKSTKVCATLNCNYIPADDLAEVIYEIVTKYMPSSVVAIERNGGFGVSVIQRLCKTSVKKNLYWEIKDKIIEEAFDGARMKRNTKRVKVYGVDSTPAVRARLIEILYERVRYHKDKFIAPIIHQEMQGMQTKKSGKVEHSDKTHDDQVFSYLMALYVWYEGKNLMENYHIQKGTIKTDEDLEIEEYEMEDALEAKATLDTNKFTMDEESEFAQDLEWVEEEVNKYKSAEEARTQDMYQNIEMRNKILAKHPELRSKIVAETGIDALGDVHDEPGFVSLPMDMFGAVDPNDDSFFDDGMPRDTYLQGNLANMFTKT